MHVAALTIYPVKSMAGVSPPKARVRPWGLEGDRRWMVVSPDGHFLTQRDHPGMALLTPVSSGPLLRLEAAGRGAIEAGATGPHIPVRVWDDVVPASTCPSTVDTFVSAVLGVPCRLVHLDDPAARPVGARWGQPGETVTFADGFPVLLTSLDSLGDLNARLATPIRINRFRGNIVVCGAPPWDEDTWRLIRIGAVIFRIAKPCDRCLVTTIEQETAARPNPSEPLRTLGTFRRTGQGVMFGQNLVPQTEGDIAAGDRVEILEAGPSNLSHP